MLSQRYFLIAINCLWR